MMAFVEPVVSLASSICNNPLTCSCVERHVNFDRDLNDLSTKYKALMGRKKGIESRMQEVSNREVVEDEVLSWLENVEDISTAVESMLKEAQRVKWCKRGCLGKRIYGTIDQVRDIYNQGTFTSIARRRPQRGTKFSLEESVAGTSTKDQILKYLMGNEVGIIGVYGNGGVGKTFIMRQVNNVLLTGTSFDKVIWVDVPYPRNVPLLQRSIARALDEKLPEGEKQLNGAAALMEIMEGMIKRMKKFVLILDDVWDNFSLTEVGIPKPSRENGSKIVITSRFHHVCKNLDCDEIVKMESLCPEDSLNLFLDKAKLARNVVHNDQFMKIIKCFVEDCAGLPLAIVMTATRLTEVEDIEEWRNAYRESNDDLCDGVSVTQVKAGKDRIFRQLRVSYDRLGEPIIQQCFLYCSLFPKGFAFYRKELIEGWIDEGLLIDRSGKRDVVSNMGYNFLKKLIKYWLLEETDGYMNAVQMHEMAIRNVDSELRSIKAFKMHDVVRKMAIQCIGPSLGYMVKAGLKLTMVPDERDWGKDLKKVSLMGNDIPKIPNGSSPDCPFLTTLILSYNPLSEIPESFFERLLALKVLDLSETHIGALPNSISNLVSLDALRLRMCRRLNRLPSLAKLTALKKLDLRMAAIEEVPQGMENLENLEYLDIHRTNLKEFPKKMSSYFPRLQTFLF